MGDRPANTSIEAIIALLNAEGIATTTSALGKERFERLIDFTIRETAYRIEWWVNVSYLHIGGQHENYILFTHMTLDTCWPSYRRGFEFINHGHTVARVAVAQLDWQEAARAARLKEADRG